MTDISCIFIFFGESNPPYLGGLNPPSAWSLIPSIWGILNPPVVDNFSTAQIA